MRLLACSAILIVAAVAATAQAPIERARVVDACVATTAPPPGADVEALPGYCQCAIDHVADAMTAEEFDVFGRYGVWRAGAGPVPSDEEMARVETADLRARMVTANEQMRETCGPLLFGPQ